MSPGRNTARLALLACAGLLLVSCGLDTHVPAAANSLAETCRDPRLQVDAATLERLRRAIPRVPAGHPRVYLRPGDLQDIRQKAASPRFQAAWAEVLEGARQPEFGYVFEAFVYLVKGDRAAGRRALSGALDALRRSGDTLALDRPFHLAALTYDWAYDLLDEAEKRAFVSQFVRIAASDSNGPCFPAAPNAPGVVGHLSTAPLLAGQLPVGVAIYDEEPRMYEAAAVTFLSSFKPVRDFYYRGHSPHAGDSYGPTYILHDQIASWLFRRLGTGDVLHRDQQFVLYRMIYDLRPDGQQLRRGDTFDDAGHHPAKTMAAQLAAYYYDDPYLLHLTTAGVFRSAAPFSGLFTLLFQRPELLPRPILELPLARYFPEPAGTLVARTGWTMGPDSPDAVVSMHVGQYFFGNHQHAGDFGTFQIFHRGPLAIASGVYEGTQYGSPHWRNYYHQTISKNGLLVLDPAEARRYQGQPLANDGGTRWPNSGNDHPHSLAYLAAHGYRMGSVQAVEIGPDPADPDHSYISGDITAAYTAKVRLVTRSMVTFNNRSSAFPATLVVFDRVHSSDARFKKTWLLHSIEEPHIAGRTIMVSRTAAPYRGRLFVESLLPTGATVTKIGGPGRQFWVESAGRSYDAHKAPPAEPGAWRIEVSPSSPAAADLFLHVLTVSDTGRGAGPGVQRIEGPTLVGARFLDRVALFARADADLASAAFTVAGTDPVRLLVCGMQPGSWSIELDGKRVATSTATPAGKCLSFRGDAGRYSLRKD